MAIVDWVWNTSGVVGLVAAILLSPPFGDASAVASADGDRLAVTVTVTVAASTPPSFVVMHVLAPGGQETFSLASVGDGRFRGDARLPAIDRAIVFEAGWEGGAYSLSETTSLTALGVPSELIGDTFEVGEPDRGGNPLWALLAAIAGGAAVGALVVYIFFPGTRERGGEASGP